MANRISPDQLLRAQWLVIAAGPMGMLFFLAISDGYVSLLARRLGASNLTVGLISALPVFCYSLPLFSSYLVSRTGSRKKVWMAFAIPYRLVWLVTAAIPFLFGHDHELALTVLVAIVFASAVFQASVSPPWFGWVGDLVGEEERGQFWARWTVAVYAVTVVGLPLMGLVLDVCPGQEAMYNFSALYVLAVAFGLVNILLHARVPEPPVETPSAENALRVVGEALRNGPFMVYTLSVAIRSMGALLMSPFVALYYRHDLGLSYTLISVLGAITYLACMVGAPYLGMLSDRFGHKPVYVLSTIGLPLTPLAYFITTPANCTWLLPIVAAVNGVAIAALTVGSNGLLWALSPADKRPGYVFTHNAVYGVLVWPFPLLGGLLSDWLGRASAMPVLMIGAPGPPPALSLVPALHPSVYHTVFFLGVVVMLAGIPLALAIRGASSRGVGFVLRNVISTNPIRLFANVNMIGIGHSRSTIMRALRDLARQRSPLAVRDLIKLLDDPSLLVREEAAAALGRIGDTAAVGPLLDKLRDPDSFLQLEAARALGQIGDPAAIDALVACLDSPRPDLRQAAARALGQIGHRRAAAALAGLCHRTDDPHLLATAVEALARIGDMHSLWDILPLLSRDTHPVFRKLLVTAVGELLGRGDEFYGLLSQEIRFRGSVVPKLTRRIAAQARPLGPETATRVAELAGRLRDAYNAEDWPHAVDALAHIVRAIGRAEFHYEGSMVDLVDVMMMRDLRFALGCWIIELMRDRADRGEPLAFEDVLVGIYFLSLHRPSLPRRRPAHRLR